MSSDLPGLQEDVPLAPLTTIGIGGEARWFLEAPSIEIVQAGLEWAARRGVPLFVLGGGSNVLISDDGFDGLVLRNRIEGIEETLNDRSALVRVGAGVDWDPFVALAVERGWAGIETLSGIPGSVGATPIQNVGAYGQEVSETIVHVEVLERTSGRLRIFSKEECRFDYRHSIFKGEAKDEFVVVAVHFELTPGGKAALRYPELKRTVEERFGNDPSLSEVREAVIAIRKRKGMVIDATDPDSRSDGSFFMNPILTLPELQQFVERAVAADPTLKADEIPTFPAGETRVKLSAAWLIEHAGFTRGYGDGPVGLSSKHTLAIVNRGGGTAVDVLRLVAEIQKKVASRFGVAIRPEPNFIGFS